MFHDYIKLGCHCEEQVWFNYWIEWVDVAIPRVHLAAIEAVAAERDRHARPLNLNWTRDDKKL